MVNLRDLTPQELESFLVSLGYPAYRGRQVYRWLFAKRASGFEDMTDLPKELRMTLARVSAIETVRVARVSPKAPDGTRKYLFELKDGFCIESVYLPGVSSRTACISTQVGCTLNCAFCATGQMGFHRNLTAAEMVSQVFEIEKEEKTAISHVVFMGMGEPLCNFDASMKAVRLFTDSSGIGLSPRHVTVSTIGIVPAVERIIREGMPARLAVSLHATTDEQRSRIIPMSKKYPLALLFKTLRAYAHVTRYPITFEYILIKDLNDRPEDAAALPQLLRNIPAKLNLIRLHPTGCDWIPSSEERIGAFYERVRAARLDVTLRVSRGLECQAACGQLAAEQPQKTEAL
ncbi:MAG: 23S rRNA (adenine(2503)-C(2))-methyltransferase RlmN [bacterium]